MKYLIYFSIFISVIFLFSEIKYLWWNNAELINTDNPVKFYEDNKNNFKITKLNYESLEVHYESDFFKKCYEVSKSNNDFLSCNNLLWPSTIYNFANTFLNEWDEWKFLLWCLLKEHWLYYDCFCKYAKDYQICENYINK